MLRFASWTLRQRRYSRLAALMLAVAIVCVAAGIWQIFRFQENLRINGALRGNAHAATVALTPSLVPPTGSGPAPGRDAVQYRSVTVTGTFLPGRQQYVQHQQEHGRGGFDVVDPLRTASGTIALVERGFVAATQDAAVPADVPAAPAGTVTLTGRLAPTSTAPDGAATSTQHQIGDVDPLEQSRALGAPVYQAVVQLDPGQSAGAGLTALPSPDLSNPAGGAVAPQHFAYIIQWFFFALLALAAPFAMARRELREARKQWLGIDPDEEQFDDDRQLTGPERDALPPGGTADADGLAVRADGEIATHTISDEQWQRAERLADRYGRALSTGGPGDERYRRRPRRVQPAELDGPAIVVDSASAVHRAEDEYHAAFNDYLWQLALADNAAPETAPKGSATGASGTKPPTDSDEPRTRG